MDHSPLEPSVTGKLAGAAAGSTPLPDVPRGTDTRVLDAWCEWLGALATDAEAALAAAIAYRELDAQGRVSWLNALEQDAVRLKVPRIAVYAPLLAVESDPERRERITFAMGPAEASATKDCLRNGSRAWGFDRWHSTTGMASVFSASRMAIGSRSPC